MVSGGAGSRRAAPLIVAAAFPESISPEMIIPVERIKAASVAKAVMGIFLGKDGT